jgi:CMP/dCMP kinase
LPSTVPAASGKGTLARRLAEHYGLGYLDTGSLYRAVALAVLRSNKAPGDEAAAVQAARTLDRSTIADGDIRKAGLGEAASIVAAFPAVRQQMLGLQRKIASTPPGAVLDGRDIGTVVCPNADVKLFVTASPRCGRGAAWRNLPSVARRQAWRMCSPG